MCSMFWSEPVSRLSRQITRWPLASRWSHRCEPRKPAPPVTMQVLMGAAEHSAAWAASGRLGCTCTAASRGAHDRGHGGARALPGDASRSSGALASSRRDALAQLASSEAALRRTARRYSLCADDAEDAYQRAVEILLTKSPPADPRHLAAWMQVVTRREALAVRRSRERLLGPQRRR